MVDKGSRIAADYDQRLLRCKIRLEHIIMQDSSWRVSEFPEIRIDLSRSFSIFHRRCVRFGCIFCKRSLRSPLSNL